MCVIVAKKQGYDLPSEEILRNCFNHNDDGCGYMYQHKEKVIIKKGFMNFKEFYKSIVKDYEEKHLKEQNLVMHFRIGTSGNMDEGATHPFPISSKNKDLTATKIYTDIGMVHNGVIYEYSHKDSKLSDTQHFIKEFVKPLYDLNKHFLDNKMIINILQKECTSKLAFLDSRDNLYTIGDFIEDNGILYSNSSYKAYTTTYDYSKCNWTTEYNKLYDNDKIIWDDFDNELDEYYDKFSYDTIVFLSDKYYYYGDYDSGVLQQCDNTMFIAENGNIYYYAGESSKFVYGELLDTNCELYTEDEVKQLDLLAMKEGDE